MEDSKRISEDVEHLDNDDLSQVSGGIEDRRKIFTFSIECHSCGDKYIFEHFEPPRTCRMCGGKNFMANIIGVRDL